MAVVLSGLLDRELIIGLILEKAYLYNFKLWLLQHAMSQKNPPIVKIFLNAEIGLKMC